MIDTMALTGKHMATTTLKVEGMTCGACTSAIESAFKEDQGVGNVSVSLIMGRAVVQHNPAIMVAEAIRERIDDCGFDAEVLSTDTPMPSTAVYKDNASDIEDDGTQYSTTTASVGGMTCSACTSAVEGAFKNVPGIRGMSISLLSERLVVEHDAIMISPKKVMEIVEDTGFDASIVRTEPTSIPAQHLPGGGPDRSKRVDMVTTVAIGGMTCGACTSAVEGGFKDLAGLKRFNISLLAERAIIVHDPLQLTPEAIAEIIEDRGFDARIVASIPSEAGSQTDSTVQLKVYGLPNEEATSNLESLLQSLAGVLSAPSSYKTFRTSVTFDTSKTGLRNIVEAIEGAGYNALLADTDDNNAQLESLAKTKEIQEWRRAFNISLSFAIPVFLTSMIFPMFVKPLDFGGIELPIPGLWLGDIVCLILTIPVQFGIGKRFYRSAFKSIRHGSPTMDVLVVLGTSAAFFFSVGAMLVSIFTPPHSRPSTVFETSTMLITFITLGRLLENGAKSHTSKALSRLMSLAPSMATIYTDPIAAEKFAEGGVPSSSQEKLAALGGVEAKTAEEKVIPTELIQIADIVILRPGDKVPADGIVTRGSSYMDESMVTGEAMPVLKSQGSQLMAGTVNGAGRLDFRVTRAGRDTQLSQIVRLVQEAQTSRAPIQRLADLVAGYFVPVIISLGVITFVGWMLLSHVLAAPPAVFQDIRSGGSFMVCLKLCISVIVFACPCALGLSTPTAVMVGTGTGAEQGILVKGGAALETATKITHVVFDKTGTLTTGKMSVANADIETPEGEDPLSWTYLYWTVIGLAEMSSEHPIAKAIIVAAREALNLGSDGGFDGSIDSFEVSVGQGVSASVTTVADGRSRRTHHIVIGNSDFQRTHGISLPTTETRPSSASSNESNIDPVGSGTTTIYTSINNIHAGTLSLSDTLKPSAAATVTALRLMNIPSSIVTGDALPTALHIARLINIPSSHVHASCSPSQKQDLIRDLQAVGHTVAMVGDGINDSPGLATADVGISLASGTDVAMEAADIVLMHAGPDDLVDVAAALHLARTIFGRIKLNLLWATGYNVIGLPFAMGVFLPWGLQLPPMAAGAAMACSSVSVVVSSLLLKFWRRPKWMDVAYLEAEGRKPRSWRRRLVDRITFAAKDLIWRKTRTRDDVAYVPLSNIEDV